MDWRTPVPNQWEITMLYNRHPAGCEKGCHCVHPADDCACDNCQKRHAYKTYQSKILKQYLFYRLN